MDKYLWKVECLNCLDGEKANTYIFAENRQMAITLAGAKVIPEAGWELPDGDTWVAVRSCELCLRPNGERVILHHYRCHFSDFYSDAEYLIDIDGMNETIAERAAFAQLCANIGGENAMFYQCDEISEI